MTRYISTTMIEYIREATVDRDMRFYSIAENFYEKMSGMDIYRFKKFLPFNFLFC